MYHGTHSLLNQSQRALILFVYHSSPATIQPKISHEHISLCKHLYFDLPPYTHMYLLRNSVVNRANYLQLIVFYVFWHPLELPW